MVLEGRGTTPAPSEAAKWYRASAEQGYSKAQVELGKLYEAGRGLPQDRVAAYMWYSLAEAQGDRYAKVLRPSLAEKLTAAEIAEAERRVEAWLAEF